MSDKELLEAAARAVNSGAWHPLTHDTPNGAWNPLTDDGDALRLAANLGMHIRFYRKHVDVDAEVFLLTNSVVSESFTGSRKEEATRRAIVRAAAAIAKP